MTQRLGTILYRLGMSLAVIAVLAALAWNVSAFQQRQQARNNFDSRFKGELGASVLEESISNRSVNDELTQVLTREFGQVRASTENLKMAMVYGGFLVIAGLIAYGLGWVARYVSRMPGSARKNDRG